MNEPNGKTWRVLLGPLDGQGLPLQQQLRQAFVTAIQSGHLPQNTRLPSSRKLAEVLGVSRNTVIAAIRLLVQSGYLESLPRSGVFVLSPPLPVKRAPPENRKLEGWLNPPALQPTLFRPQARFPEGGNRPFSFLDREYDADLFPIVGWREATRATSTIIGIKSWLGGRVQQDDAELCHELRTKVLPTRGIWAAEDEVMITSGIDHGLFLASQIFLSGGRTAAIEVPGYPQLRSIVRLFTSSVVHLSVDADGAVPGPEMMSSDVIFLTCPSHCPTTVAMSEERRRRFLSAAARAGKIIVEYEADATLEVGAEQMALRAADRTGNVIHIGSLSGVLAHSLQIGFLVGQAKILGELRALNHLMLGHPPANNQRALALLISLGRYQNHLTQLRETMAMRCHACEVALTTYLPEVTWQRRRDATHFWLTFPEDIDTRTLATAAHAHGVLIESGTDFFADPEGGRHNVRLSLGGIGAARISDGIRMLAAAMSQQRYSAGR